MSANLEGFHQAVQAIARGGLTVWVLVAAGCGMRTPLDAADANAWLGAGGAAPSGGAGGQGGGGGSGAGGVGGSGGVTASGGWMGGGGGIASGGGAGGNADRTCIGWGAPAGVCRPEHGWFMYVCDCPGFAGCRYQRFADATCTTCSPYCEGYCDSDCSIFNVNGEQYGPIGDDPRPAACNCADGSGAGGGGGR
jgi:hypothetical protein